MICVSVQESSLNGCLEILKGVPMAEVRADLCKLTIQELEKVVESHPNLIITCRIANSSIEFAREQIITAIRKGAKYVDIEIEAPVDYLEYVKTYAQVNGAKVIISYHNYEATQSIEELELIADICKRKGADIVKIVTTANDISDAVRTLSLYKRGHWAKEFKTNNYSDNKDVMLLAFSMGEAGQFSRYLSIKFGAPFTYVSLPGAATAPGQYTVEEMEKLLKKGAIELNYNFTRQSTTIPCSKSVAQRAILAAAFAKGVTRLRNFEPCNDISAALQVVEQFGCKVKVAQENIIEIESGGVEAIKEKFKADLLSTPNEKEFEWNLNAGESGLLSRLLAPFAAYISDYASRDLLDKEIVINIIGNGSLISRNMKETAVAINAIGATCTTAENGHLPFKVRGQIRTQQIRVSGRESSQTISGLLMMLPLLPFDTTLEVVNPVSLPYISLTLELLEEFGVTIGINNFNLHKLLFTIPGNQQYRACSLNLEPDWSSASFFAVGYALASMRNKRFAAYSEAGNTGNVRFCLKEMKIGTNQADEAVLGVLTSVGVKVEIKPSGSKKGFSDIYIEAPDSLDSFEFDATNTPDLFPALALLALFCKGRSIIGGVGRLLEKESNRARSIFTEFTSFGADIDIVGDYMYINGNMRISPQGSVGSGDTEEEKWCNLHSHNDHRIAMSLIVASIFVGYRCFLNDIECINKSFPSFLSRL